MAGFQSHHLISTLINGTGMFSYRLSLNNRKSLSSQTNTRAFQCQPCSNFANYIAWWQTKGLIKENKKETINAWKLKETNVCVQIYIEWKSHDFCSKIIIYIILSSSPPEKLGTCLDTKGAVQSLSFSYKGLNSKKKKNQTAAAP